MSKDKRKRSEESSESEEEQQINNNHEEKENGSSSKSSAKKKQKSENGTAIAVNPSKSDSKNVIKINEDEEKKVDHPLKSFRISKDTRHRLKERGITSLFPIQASTFNFIYDGKDIIGRGKKKKNETKNPNLNSFFLDRF